jgi:membrane protein required for colicin V production
MELSELQNFDYLILAIIGLSIYVGWKNGLIKSFIAFFAWIGSAIIVFDSYDAVFAIVDGFIHSKFISSFIASIGLYIGLVILFSMLGDRTSKAAAKFGGSTTDNVTGAVFGALCGGLIVCTLFWGCYISLMTLNDKKLPQWFVGARSYKLLKIGSDSLMGVAFSEEERAKLINLVKKKSNKLEDEVKKNFTKKQEETSNSSEAE